MYDNFAIEGGIAFIINNSYIEIRNSLIRGNLAFIGSVLYYINCGQESYFYKNNSFHNNDGEGNTLFTKEEFIEAYNNGTGISFISSSFVNSLPSDYLFPTDSSTYRALSGRLRFNMVILQNEN
jgi:hypothetical protein